MMLEIYIGLSAIIGLVVIFDGYVVVKNNGVVETNQIIVLTTTIEFVWAIVSVFALFTLNFQQWQILIPVLYLTHNIIGWVYGVLLVSKLPKEPVNKVMVLLWYAKFGFNFGVVFTLACGFILYQMYL
ncbi:hypothetical protein [Thalassotalea piscium]|uniref:Uncharacterized protein n=1 Tax=Thalassotalea piscium TaxID=1230533 RepID=A0A7X0TTU8_9GAMM|nr:hypothetical protein [Thalassotalea piscium]MBB6543450.1 hypothetical protein [Thalassotalea piscium]